MTGERSHPRAGQQGARMVELPFSKGGARHRVGRQWLARSRALTPRGSPRGSAAAAVVRGGGAVVQIANSVGPRLERCRLVSRITVKRLKRVGLYRRVKTWVFIYMCLSDSNCECYTVAPMMDYTTAHFRFMCRLLSLNTWLYTEMEAGMGVVHVFCLFAHHSRPGDCLLITEYTPGTQLRSFNPFNPFNSSNSFVRSCIRSTRL